MSQPAEGVESDLVDLTGVPLADLPTHDQTALRPVLTRIARRLRDHDVYGTDYQQGGGSSLD